MKKIAITVLFAILSLAVFTGCEQEKFTVPTLTGRVVDKTNTLSKSDVKELETAIKDFEQSTKGQFAVCIVPYMTGETVETASMKVAESWKIGQKGKDNGILFFLSMREREFRIEVGYGFEGKLNDAKAGDIGRLAIPHFQKKHWKAGINTVIVGCNDVISGNKKAIGSQEKSKMSDLVMILTIIISVIILLVMIGCIVDGSDNDGGNGGFFGGHGDGGIKFFGGGGGFGGGGFSGKF